MGKYIVLFAFLGFMCSVGAASLRTEPKELPKSFKCAECDTILQQLTDPNGDPTNQARYCPNEKCSQHKVLIDD